MGLVKQYLNSIEGVEIYAIISLLIFFLFFVAVIIHTIMIRKSKIKEFSRLPLEEDDQFNQTNQKTN